VRNNILRISLVVFLLGLVFSCASKNNLSGNIGPESNMPDLKNDPSMVDEASVKEKMTEKAADFDRCYTDEIQRDRSAQVKKVMSLVTISKEGNVISSSLISSIPVSADFKDCFKKIFSQMKFSPVSSDRPVLIFYPVEYKSAKN
jgi:hypothetical protein